MSERYCDGIGDDVKGKLAMLDIERRTSHLEVKVDEIKPIVYNTQETVKTLTKSMDKIEPMVYSHEQMMAIVTKSVQQMEQNSDKIKGYIMAAAISGIAGIIFLTLQNQFFN